MFLAAWAQERNCKIYLFCTITDFLCFLVNLVFPVIFFFFFFCKKNPWKYFFTFYIKMYKKHFFRITFFFYSVGNRCLFAKVKYFLTFFFQEILRIWFTLPYIIAYYLYFLYKYCKFNLIYFKLIQNSNRFKPKLVSSSTLTWCYCCVLASWALVCRWSAYSNYTDFA